MTRARRAWKSGNTPVRIDRAKKVLAMSTKSNAGRRRMRRVRSLR